MPDSSKCHERTLTGHDIRHDGLSSEETTTDRLLEWRMDQDRPN